jgi:tetratricopeptide (TPR) repeat protein
MRRRSGSEAPVARAGWVCAGLVLATLLVYFPTTAHPFINFDDPQYVAENPPVLDGVTAAGIRWAFTTGHAGNWHPLTWLSHMLDVELFGADAGRHHLVSVALHAANAALLFLVLLTMTGALWRPAIVAALFALHPTHVESVAWIAERKDVLSTFFWLLAMWAYSAYAASPSPRRYLVVAIAMIAGLLSKPMVVTLPFVFLLLDVWPLRRTLTTPWRRLAVEKIPLLALSIVSGVVTFLVQREAGAVRALDVLPVPRRIASAALGYWEYLWKTIWPADLALLYPHPASVSWLLVAAAIAGLIVASLVVVRAGRQMPWLAVGWFWFLGTLVPVIGLVQVGSQRIADRYTYVPTIGLFVIAAWGGAELLRRTRIDRRLLASGVAALLVVHGSLAHAQVRRWSSSIGIWQHTIAVTSGNARAHNHLGHALAAAGRDAEALEAYETALRFNPDSPEALNNMGALLARHGDNEPAIVAFERAIGLAPALPHARGNLGLALVHAGRPAEAVVHLEEAVRQAPGNAELWRRLGIALAMTERPQDAIGALENAVRLEPGDAVTHNALGAAYGGTGRSNEAVEQYREAVRLDPALFEARANLGRTLLDAGEDEGKRVLHELALDLLRDGQLEPALQALEAILRRDPQYAPARATLEDLAARSRARSVPR